MDKQNIVYPYNGLVSGSKRNEILRHGYKMDEAWKYFVKGKRVGMKRLGFMIPFM